MRLSFDEFRRAAASRPPRVFLVLGSGQGAIGARIQDVRSVSFAEVPDMPLAHVPGHRGCLTLGKLGGVDCLVSEGRIHGYEGHPHSAIVLTTRLAAELGVKVALFTNAAGGIRDDLKPGSLLPLRSMMDWQHPGRHRDVNPFSPRLLELFGMWPGVYAAVSGPSYETPAEIRALRRAGADAVGMSTCPEAREAVKLGLETAAISLITNKAAGLGGPIDHAEVLHEARAAGQILGDLLERVISRS